VPSVIVVIIVLAPTAGEGKHVNGHGPH